MILHIDHERDIYYIFYLYINGGSINKYINHPILRFIYNVWKIYNSWLRSNWIIVNRLFWFLNLIMPGYITFIPVLKGKKDHLFEIENAHILIFHCFMQLTNNLSLPFKKIINFIVFSFFNLFAHKSWVLCKGKN